MVGVEAVASVDTTAMAVDMVVGVAVDFVADDLQRKRSRGDDENVGSNKDRDRDRDKEHDHKYSSGRHSNERERI